MPISRYAGVGEICPDFTITTASEGSLSSGSLYFSFQLQNRCGFNLPSVSSQITYSSGQKITITIPESVRKEAWDIRYYIISAGASSDASTHVQIARVSNYEHGDLFTPQSTQISLPITLELTQPDHISLAGTIATLANFPTGSNRLDGQVRWVTSESKWFEYRADSDLPTSVDVIDADEGQWVRVSSPSTYVSNTTSGVGCDRPLPSVNPIYTVQPPPYPGDSNLGKVEPDWDLKYWVYNETNVNIPEGLEFGIDLQYLNLRSPDLLNGLFLIEFLGYAQSDGTLRTARIDDDTEFTNIGGYVPWTPKSQTPFYLPDDVLPGEAIALSVKPFFSVAELNGEVPPGSVFSVIPVIRTQSGDFNAIGYAFSGKGVVWPGGDQYRIVPELGLSYRILQGHAIVANYSFPIKPARSYGGLSANTAGQKVVINGNAAVYTESPSYTIQSSEALRALVSTIAGESNPGAWSGYLAIASGQAARVTLTYPCNASGLGTVRSDYPVVLAGNTKGKFNPLTVNIYIQRQDTLEIRKFTGNLVTPGTSQIFTITNWTDGTIVGSLPTAPNAEFSLYAPGASAIASADIGSFPTGTSFRVCHTFVYDGNQITSISHDSPPCISEWNGNFEPPSVEVNPDITIVEPDEDATVENSGTGNQAYLTFSIPKTAPTVVATIAELKALTSSTTPKRYDGVIVAIADTGDGFPGWYRYNAAATDTEDLPSIVSPTDTTGRWFLFTGGTTGNGTVGLVTTTLCTHTCTLGQKAIKFYVAETVTLQIKPAIGFSVATASDAIKVRTWTSEPNTGMTGKETPAAATLTQAGGEATVTITTSRQWVTVEARNPANSNAYDTACLLISGSTIALVGY